MLIIGIKVRMPAELSMKSQPMEPAKIHSYGEYVEQFRDRIFKANKLALEDLGKADFGINIVMT
jgi:hypothetical protein